MKKRKKKEKIKSQTVMHRIMQFLPFPASMKKKKEKEKEKEKINILSRVFE